MYIVYMMCIRLFDYIHIHAYLNNMNTLSYNILSTHIYTYSYTHNHIHLIYTGVGPKTALKMIRQHKTLEDTVAAIKKEKKYEVPIDWSEMRIPVKTAADIEETEGAEEGEEGEGEEAGEEVDVSVDVAETKGTEEAVVDVVEDVVEVESVTVDPEVPLSPSATTSHSSSATTPASATTAEVVEVEIEGVEYETVPPLYQQARVLFTHAHVTPAEEVDLKWVAPDEEGLRAFLVSILLL